MHDVKVTCRSTHVVFQILSCMSHMCPYMSIRFLVCPICVLIHTSIRHVEVTCRPAHVMFKSHHPEYTMYVCMHVCMCVYARMHACVYL